MRLLLCDWETKKGISNSAKSWLHAMTNRRANSGHSSWLGAAVSGKIPESIRCAWLDGRSRVSQATTCAWRVNAVGLAQYRAGQFDRAIQSLQESNRLVWGLAVPQEYAVNWFVMAMVHHRLGQSDAARQCLETGRKLMDLGRPKTPDEPAKFTAPADWIMANVLLAKAECFCNLLPQAPDRAREIILRALSLAILLGLAGSRWPGMHRDDERRLVSSISLTFRIVVESELKKVILILAYRPV